MADSQKYSKSANLFTATWESGTLYSGGGEGNDSNSIRTDEFINCSPNTTYDYNANYEVDEAWVNYYTADSGISRYKITNGSFTTPENCTRLRFRLTKTDLGTEPIPQPQSELFTYGWLHSLRKQCTATETIQSGDTIYADGTVATVSLKGNEQHTGTPSPSNPVDVNGVGELETTGEHAGEYKIPISSGGVTTNIYLGSTQTVRQIRKHTFTGEETTFSCVATTDGQNYCVAYRFIDVEMADIKGFDKNMQNIDYPIFISSHFVEKTNTYSTFNDIQPNQVGANTLGITYESFNRYIIFCVAGLTTAADYQAWFAQQYANDTPVEVYYILETETTAAVNEPLMKIGTYADTLSNATAIPTTEGANSITVDTTVQPSEFTATWTGWHDATVKEWDGTNWQ